MMPRFLPINGGCVLSWPTGDVGVLSRQGTRELGLQLLNASGLIGGPTPRSDLNAYLSAALRKGTQ